MRTAIVIIVIVLALIVGGLLTLRRSAKTGMPSKDVLDRATRRARELEEQDKREDEE
jgi:FtsZ-interacting cell division protein ZipA